MGSYDPITGTKRCAKCEKTKPTSEFNRRNKHGRDPFAGYCRSCQKEKYKAWAEVNSDKIKTKNQKWYEQNIHRVRARDALRYLTTDKREKRNQSYVENTNRYKAYGQNYRAKKASGGSFSEDDIAKIFKMQRGKCAICKSRLGAKYSIDHIVPIAKGGTNLPSNLQLAHLYCNVRKGSTDPLIFMRREGFLL